MTKPIDELKNKLTPPAVDTNPTFEEEVSNINEEFKNLNKKLEHQLAIASAELAKIKGVK
jgi:hypothetical protein